MPTRITSALETKPDIPHGSATLVTPARKTATAGIFDLEFKHSVAEAFSAADENSVVSLDGSKHATVKPKWTLTRGFPLNAGRDRRDEFNIAKTESLSYRPRFLSYARVQRHSSVGRRQLDRAM